MELQHTHSQAGSQAQSPSKADARLDTQDDTQLLNATLEDDSAPVDRVRIIAYRKKKKESQRRFWARFGVTQSRGSRFESGAEIPAPVSILLGLYFTKTISDGDLGRAERVVYHRETRTLVNLGQ
ncbi:helix-turn-helix transcriptional regulator [Paraburkholderia phosphatilytica]|uniref:helix-turn-helix transcriptional regulator n=1 Tax=Paraburkholderia phosphatilytica TaxID=2282883 RepID=UPI001F0B79C8|nr:helix-turn-helix transcriptional regulator [Paraburkholderia phosphatilytica]